MKIDTSIIGTTVTEQYAETGQAERTGTIEFWRTLDDQQHSVSEATLHDRTEWTRQYETKSAAVMDNTESLHPLAVYRGIKQSVYMRNTAIDNLVDWGKGLSDEQWAALSDKAREKLAWANEVKNIQTSFQGGVAAPDPAGVPAFESSGSVVADIETMVQWLEKSAQLSTAMSNAPCMGQDSSAELKFSRATSTDLFFGGLEPVNPADYLPDTRGRYDYALSTQTHGEYHIEKSVRWAAQGSVRTEGGDEYQFCFNWESETVADHTVDFSDEETGPAGTDSKVISGNPMVISLDGETPAFTSSRFSFDLDGDGTREDIRMMAQGSGFLCLDKNMDGTINDGNELFGPHTGNGFHELLKYDTDENFWIDENDEIYSQLAFWENDGQGNMTLKTLEEAGIGAIYLGHARTESTLKDEGGEAVAKIRSSGIALKEDGSVSVVREMAWLV